MARARRGARAKREEAMDYTALKQHPLSEKLDAMTDDEFVEYATEHARSLSFIGTSQSLNMTRMARARHA